MFRVSILLSHVTLNLWLYSGIGVGVGVWAFAMIMLMPVYYSRDGMRLRLHERFTLPPLPLPLLPLWIFFLLFIFQGNFHSGILCALFYWYCRFHCNQGSMLSNQNIVSFFPVSRLAECRNDGWWILMVHFSIFRFGCKMWMVFGVCVMIFQVEKGRFFSFYFKLTIPFQFSSFRWITNWFKAFTWSCNRNSSALYSIYKFIFYGVAFV